MADLTKIREDLYQTRMDSPFPGLTTHAYLWRRPAGNVLFYSPVGDADFDAIDELGGVSAQYLSHLDEAGPNLARIAERFGRQLHAPAAELEAIAEHGHVDVPLDAVEARRRQRCGSASHAGSFTRKHVLSRDGRRWRAVPVHRRHHLSRR